MQKQSDSGNVKTMMIHDRAISKYPQQPHSADVSSIHRHYSRMLSYRVDTGTNAGVCVCVCVCVEFNDPLDT